jgi:hypothetical protein
MKFKVLGIALLALFAGAAFAEDMKPGLWEITTESALSEEELMAAMSPAERELVSAAQQKLAAMSPAEREQMEAEMAKQNVKIDKTGATVRGCFTPPMTKCDYVPKSYAGCAVTASLQDGNTCKMSVVCDGYSIETEETYHNDSTLSGKMRTIRGEEVYDWQLSGRWLGADCGDVKPIE